MQGSRGCKRAVAGSRALPSCGAAPCTVLAFSAPRPLACTIRRPDGVCCGVQYGQITDSMHGSMTAGQQLGSNAAHGPASDHMYGDASYDDLANATDRTLVNNTSWNRGQTANGGRAYAKQQAADLQAEWSATDRNPSPFSAPGRQAAGTQSS